VRLRLLSIAIGWALVAAIVWLSLTPSPPSLEVAWGDKLGHFAAYGTLMFWFCQIYPRRGTRISYAAGFVALGIALEFAQGAIGYRSFELFDMLANAIGVGLGWSAAIVARRGERAG